MSCFHIRIVVVLVVVRTFPGIPVPYDMSFSKGFVVSSFVSVYTELVTPFLERYYLCPERQNLRFRRSLKTHMFLRDYFNIEIHKSGPDPSATYC